MRVRTCSPKHLLWNSSRLETSRCRQLRQTGGPAGRGASQVPAVAGWSATRPRGPGGAIPVLDHDIAVERAPDRPGVGRGVGAHRREVVVVMVWIGALHPGPA